MSNMRITFVIPSANLSGGSRIIAEHARILHERGHQVTVVSGRRREPGRVDKLKALARGRRILRHRSGPTHFDDAPYPIHTIDRARPVLADDVPDGDLVIATWWETAEWVWALPESKGCKINFLQGHEIFPWLPVDRVRAVWQLPMPKIVVSQWLRDIARDEYGDNNAVLVPNGLDTDHFRFVERGLTGSRVIGAMASGMGQQSIKRFWLAVETVKVLQSRGLNCQFIGFGGSPTDPDVMPVGSAFEVAPPQNRIAEIYASCDCWLFTSDKEGYGLPILEAMACGTPVVATPAGAAPELLASGGGKLVDSDDPEVLAAAVEEILNLDDESWRAMSRAARAEAEKHSWDVIGDQMEAALLALVENSAASSPTP